jgi:hypothetical protein
MGDFLVLAPESAGGVQRKNGPDLAKTHELKTTSP